MREGMKMDLRQQAVIKLPQAGHVMFNVTPQILITYQVV